MSRLMMDEKQIDDLTKLSREEGFPIAFTGELMERFAAQCRAPSFYLFGEYCNDRLVSVGALSVFYVFPCSDSPGGLIGHISGVYTHPDYRRLGYSSVVMHEILEAGRDAGCDYVCLDSTADELYRKLGFIDTPEGETRLWLPLNR